LEVSFAALVEKTDFSTCVSHSGIVKYGTALGERMRKSGFKGDPACVGDFMATAFRGKSDVRSIGQLEVIQSQAFQKCTPR
jgi:hypothetical protein